MQADNTSGQPENYLDHTFLINVFDPGIGDGKESLPYSYEKVHFDKTLGPDVMHAISNLPEIFLRPSISTTPKVKSMKNPS